MRHAVPTLVLLVLLAACGSTAQPAARQDAPGLPTVTPEAAPRSAPGSATQTASAPGATVARATPSPVGDGPQTASMAALRIGGERYAALGDPDAPVTMVEFSDYGCPYCRLYGASGFPEIKRRFVDTGKVYYVFKDYPVVELHPQAVLAAQAAECAGEQNAYWALHNQLFTEPDEWGAGQQAALDAFGRYAEVLGLDRDALLSCIGDGRYAGEVGADYAEARALGLAGTPAFLINGKLLSGARATEQFVMLVQREIDKATE